MLKKFQKLSKASRSGVALSLLGAVGWSLAILVVQLFEWIFEQPTLVNPWHFMVIPGTLVVIGVVVNFFELNQRLKIHPVYVTVILTALHGMWAQYVGLQINPAYNGYIVLFFFSFGLLYLKTAFGWKGTLTFTVVNMLLAVGMIRLLDVDFGTDEAVFLIFFMFHGTSSSFINEMNRRKSQHLKNEIMLRKHSYDQLQKILFPHQLTRLAHGDILETTMPVEQGLGCCVLFEVIESSKVRHESAQQKFREIFAAFSILVQEEYDEQKMWSRAFRRVELNNRFVCTVGFPFRSPNSERPSRVALRLAHQFIQVFHEKVGELDYPDPVYCSVSVASGEMEGFFTQGFPIEYQLYGEPLIRVENMNELRKFMQYQKGITGSIILIQDRVFNSLEPLDREQFKYIDIDERRQILNGEMASNSFYYLNLRDVSGQDNGQTDGLTNVSALKGSA